MSRPEPREFIASVGGVPVRVVYTERWLEFPDLRMNTDHFAFHSVEEPAKPHPLSNTGYLSHFAEPIMVEHFRGAEWYVTAFAESKLRGRGAATRNEARQVPPDPEPPKQMSLF